MIYLDVIGVVAQSLNMAQPATTIDCSMTWLVMQWVLPIVFMLNNMLHILDAHESK